MSDLRTIVIDGSEIDVDPALTLIQACEQAGVEIPRFCYHERLSIAGNCRMCLVEVVGGPPKPAASCAMQVRDLRPGKDGAPPEVRTNSPMVKKAREGVMEFLLINHPLDCPICDQGGECDLQDQAMAYGVDFSRYREPKRAVVDLDLGPLVETHMTRCISCTRCVRFTTEVAGVSELGQLGRGEDSEISAYLGETLASELQGNIIDLCPVGALVSKPYAFTARPWELTHTESVDVMDALGASIRLDAKGREIMRILPRNHDGTNEEWISDKTRFCYDGLRRQRLDKPYVREGGRLRPATWPEALGVAAAALKGANRVSGLVGDLASVETAFALKALIEGLGGVVESRTDRAALPAGNRSGYVGTALVEEIDDAETILLIGTNPRLEAPVLNARIRKAWLKGARVARIGEEADLSYPVTQIGEDPAALERLAGEDHSDERDVPGIVIVGQGALARPDGAAILGAAMAMAEAAGSELLILHTAAGRVGALDVGAACEGGLDAALAAEVVYSRRRGRGGDPAGAVRDLPGLARRPRRAPRRRHPALGRVDRGAGALRQHRGASPDGVPRGFRAGGGQGQLGHPARPVGGGRRHAALRLAGAAQAGPGEGASASAGHRRGAPERVAPGLARHRLGRAASLRRAGLPPVQSHRAGLRGHGHALLQRPRAPGPAAAGRRMSAAPGSRGRAAPGGRVSCPQEPACVMLAGGASRRGTGDLRPSRDGPLWEIVNG